MTLRKRTSKQEMQIAFFGRMLLKWWRLNKRTFPWREKRTDAFGLIVAEVLLRKTTAKQAEKVYAVLLERWPDPCKLSLADEEELRHLLKPLGIHRQRAKQLILLGKTLCDKFGPKIDKKLSINELSKIPGLGPYASNAVLAVTRNEPLPGLDRNFIRIIERVFSVKSAKKRPHTDPALWAFASSLVPKGKARDFNWAIVDFGASVCRPRRPLCGKCPLTVICSFYRESQRMSNSTHLATLGPPPQGAFAKRERRSG